MSVMGALRRVRRRFVVWWHFDLERERRRFFRRSVREDIADLERSGAIVWNNKTKQWDTAPRSDAILRDAESEGET